MPRAAAASALRAPRAREGGATPRRGAARALRRVAAGAPRCRAAAAREPVAMPAAPHLVDPALGDAGAELRFVVDDRRPREVLDFPAGASKPELEVDLLRVEKEALVERPDLVQRLPAKQQSCARQPVDAP